MNRFLLNEKDQRTLNHIKTLREHFEPEVVAREKEEALSRCRWARTAVRARREKGAGVLAGQTLHEELVEMHEVARHNPRFVYFDFLAVYFAVDAAEFF